MAPDLVGLADLLAARGGRLGRPLTIVESTTSTNDDAKAGAKAGAAHGALWVAEEQTRGRGRQGREWRSPRGENLLFSVVLRLGCPPARLPLLSLVAGLAVRDAIAKSLAGTGRTANVGVKWPNDVVIQQPGEERWRKVAGILVESSLTGARVEHAVIGVGINVHTRDFPPELAAIATSLAEVPAGLTAVAPLDRGAILADVLENLDRTAEHVAHRGLGILHGRLAQHDVLAGVAVASDDGKLEGTGAGIDLEGRLLVRGDLFRRAPRDHLRRDPGEAAVHPILISDLRALAPGWIVVIAECRRDDVPHDLKGDHTRPAQITLLSPRIFRRPNRHETCSHIVSEVPVMDILRWTRRAVAGGAVFFGFLACSSPPSSGLNPDKSTEKDKDDDDDKDSKPAASTGDTTPSTPTTNMTLTKIDPAAVGIGTAPQGLTVTLTGTNFVNGVRVSVGGLVTNATFVDAQTIKVVVPADKLAVQGNVALAAVSASEAKSNELSLAVGTGAAGGLISLSPTGSPIGVQSVVLNVTGSGFDATSIVVFNNSDVATQVLSPTNLRAVVPGFLLRQTGQVNVAVRKGGVLSSPVPFNVGQSGGGFCEMSCQEVGLFPGQCASTGGGFGFDFFGFDLGSLFGSKVQCGFDGCIHDGCD